MEAVYSHHEGGETLLCTQDSWVAMRGWCVWGSFPIAIRTDQRFAPAPYLLIMQAVHIIT